MTYNDSINSACDNQQVALYLKFGMTTQQYELCIVVPNGLL